MAFIRFVVFLSVTYVMLFQVAYASLVTQDNSNHLGCIVHRTKKDGNGNTKIANTRPRMEFSLISPKGYFKIHYDTTESNAVSTLDNNNNKIPDYIDSTAAILDESYDVEINKLGFRKPLPDFDDPSTIDVYVVQLGKSPGYAYQDYPAFIGLYGVTLTEDSNEGVCSSDTTSKINTSTAIMFIDNDFSITDSITGQSGKMRRTYSETGYSALRVTCYHEFNHMIQLAYKAGDISALYYEMTSTWLEHIGNSNSTDYFQYLRSLMNSSETAYFSDQNYSRDAGYNHAFVLQYLQENYGGKIVSEWWDLIGTCVQPLRALDSVCKRRGTTFPDAWKSMMKWIYYTNYRAKDTLYFNNATAMPLVKPNNDGGNNGTDMEYTTPSYTRSISLYPFQFKFIRCVLPSAIQNTPDTVDFVATNSNLESAINENTRSIEYTLTVSQNSQGNARRIGSSDFYYTTLIPNGEYLYDTLFYNGGFITQLLDSPYPQPLSLTRDNLLTFPIPDAIPAGSNIKLTVFSPDIGGYEVDNKIKPMFAKVVVVNKKRVVLWDALPKELSTGMYLFSIEWNDSTYLGKFLVKQ